MNRKKQLTVILLAIVCCAVMAFVDGWLRPGYALKSAIKIVVFLGAPLAVTVFQKELSCMGLFRPGRKGLLIAAGLGLAVYGVILGAYLIVRPFFDFSGIAVNLTANAGVNADNFLFVSLYISFINSLLEEFFFRGFLFTNLKKYGSSALAYGISAGLFALYHVAMMTGWFSPILFILVMVGLTMGGMIFNFLNERLGSIYPSWLVHMFANFAINTIGFILLT